MKHLKMLGLFAMAAAALMAFAGSASAAEATFTAPAGTGYHGTLSSSLEGSALLKAGFAEITCTSGTVEGKIEAPEAAKETEKKELKNNNATEASGKITAVSFSNCKEGQTVDTLNNNGTLTILKSNTAVSGTGTEVTTAVGGISCVYGLGATSTSLGTASNTASGVTLAIKASLPKISGGFLCASPASWTANYIVTTPSGSVVD
jgi:hypothetical protein